ncbi:translation initiation factor IF-2-like [Aricia agestis]|uniref:translation initiation factor IF-2-like n=1 Tax=Aricia agestis TaxID=91739 RepID=UPI001C202334|nr:translation initiation factor IF-2-like [Aricia agestis]
MRLMFLRIATPPVKDGLNKPPGLPALSEKTRRKRRSDDDVTPPLSKGAVPKAKRGRGRPPTTGQYVGLAKAQADLNREKEEALRLQAEEEVAEAARAARETRSSLLASPAPMEEDRPEQTIHALAQCVETSLGTISMVAAKSNNLKGTFQRLLKEAVSDIRTTVAAMKNRGATEEIRALEAQNARLQQEVESMRKELEALRQKVSKPAEQDMRQLLSEVSRSNVETFSNMLNARLAGLESRLLPEPRLRPPLAADRARSVTPATVESVEAIPEQTPGTPKPKAKGKPAQKKTRQPVATEAPQEAPAAPEAPKAKKGRKKKKRPSMAAQEAAQGGATISSPGTETPWTTVGPKGGKKKGAATPSTAPPKKKKKPRLRVPATAAALETARRAVNIAEFDIPQVRFRRARTGGRLLTIAGEGAEKKADAFAARLRTVLPQEVKVGRPAACAEMRIAGLDDSVTAAEIMEAVALEGECLAGDVRPGHKAAECGAAEPNCSLCEAAGRVERGHELGRCPSAKKPAPGEDKAPTKKARQKSRPRGARAPLAPARMETDA